MAIVTISRASFSGSKMLADRLSERLGYRCIDRDALVRKAATPRVSAYDLRSALEFPPVYPGKFNHTRYIYLTLIQAALAADVRSGCAVCHGLAGHLLLRGAPGLLRLRIIAPMEHRVCLAQQELNLSRGEAMAHISSLDRDHRKWTQFLYGLDWGDSLLYDLVVNLENTTIDQATHAVASLIQCGAFAVTEEDRLKLSDLALACAVRAALARDPATMNLEFEVESQDGQIYVHGECAAEMTAVQRVVSMVPGVNGLTIDASVPVPATSQTQSV
jgi:cytidylate kinase